MIVIARKYGQLGNRLFLFAHLIAAARHYGVELRNPCFGDYAHLFPSTHHDLWCRYIPDRPCETPPAIAPSRLSRDVLMSSLAASAKLLHGIGLRRFPAQVIRLRSGEECDLLGDRFGDAVASGRPVLVQGWLFRSGPLMQLHADAIREFFRLHADRQTNIRRVIASARRDCDLLIGVHVRRGDYATFQGGQYFFDDTTYATWMQQICDQFPDRRVRFLVCSHETLDETKYRGLNLSRGPGSAVEDMYALAETDWMIGPPSTFTAWAAFMGNKERLELHAATQHAIAPHHLLIHHSNVNALPKKTLSEHGSPPAPPATKPHAA